MKRSHARFESLEGAILLGEATLAEREEYSLHARQCSLCCGEPANGALPASVGAGRDAETWRPSVDHPVLARVRDERMRRSRFAVGALGWAAACSIAVNVAFVTGVAGKLGGALDFGNAPAAAAPAQFAVRLPPETFATIKRRALPPVPSTLASARTSHHRGVASAAHVQRLPARSVEPPAPDIFAGLDVRGSGAARSVAVETFPCEGMCATQASAPNP